MNIYQSTVDYLLKVPVLQAWNESKTILERFASVQPRDWRLPVIMCEAMGGSVEQGLPAAAAFACAQIGIILVDDMLDEDPRGEYRHVGAAQAANLATAFLSAGPQVILHSKAQATAKLSALLNLNQMILTTAFGQYLDVQNPQDEDGYWRVVKTKSAPFFGTGLYIGALFAGASRFASGKAEKIGHLYGEIIQIHDDLNDTMSTPANPDWIQGRSPLPILYARLVDHPERAKFLELCRNVTNPPDLQEAQEILIRCGAISYCVDQLLRRQQAAQEILGTLSLARRDAIEVLLEETVRPVWNLIKSIGETSPEPTM